MILKHIYYYNVYAIPHTDNNKIKNYYFIISRSITNVLNKKWINGVEVDKMCCYSSIIFINLSEINYIYYV